MRTRLLAATLAFGLSGCVGGVAVTARSPQLVYVEPGIQVVVDWHEPVFYTDSYYWRYEGNVWYRSRVATGGWVRFDAPPHLLRIERPQQYVHYRPRDRGPVVRDHRTPTPVVERERQPRPPVVRDAPPPPPDRGRDDHDKGKGKDDQGKGKGKDDHGKGPH